MIQGLVSVVLPIYNVEKYLDRCMESVVNQTYSNIEILMIDDGATDSCPDICEKWAKKDERVKVIHKQNAGLGMARNTGIEKASGEYIVFFDSDDYIEVDTIEKCYKKATEDKADLVLFGHSLISSTGEVKSQVIPFGKKTNYKGSEIKDVVLPNLLMQSSNAPEIKNLWMSAWSCFYSCKMIEETGWDFVSERKIISEDVYSLLQLFSYLNSVSIIEESLYNYCENAASLTHVYRDDRFEKINIFYKETMSEAERLGYSKDILSAIAYPYIANIIAMIKMVVNSDLNSKKKKEKLKEITADTTLLNAIDDINRERESLSRKLLFDCIKARKILSIIALVKINNMVR